jgi:hypothetical protein
MYYNCLIIDHVLSKHRDFKWVIKKCDRHIYNRRYPYVVTLRNKKPRSFIFVKCLDGLLISLFNYKFMIFMRVSYRSLHQQLPKTTA